MAGNLTFAGRDTTLQAGDMLLVSTPHGCVRIECIRQGTIMKINGAHFTEIIGLSNSVCAQEICELLAAGCNLRCVLLMRNDPEYAKYKQSHGVHIDLFELQT